MDFLAKLRASTDSFMLKNWLREIRELIYTKFDGKGKQNFNIWFFDKKVQTKLFNDDWNFYDQILQAVTILDKKLKIFSLHFFQCKLLFF